MRIQKNIAVIGAGPSGMIAAIFAARSGCRVTVFEKQKKAGRKLSITGNGQCNITNSSIDQSRYHGHNTAFVRSVFSRFGLDETIDFFYSIGIPLVEKKHGKLFPHSFQAQSVSDILEYEMAKAGAELILHKRIDRIIPSKKGLTLESPGEQALFDSVIVACGSCAYPQLGASPDVYDLVRPLGHHIYEPFPAILPVTVPLRVLHRLEGIKWECGVKAVSGGRTLASSEGEVLFTKYGISGPATLDVSRALNEALVSGRDAHVVLDLFPDRSVAETEELMEFLLADPSKKLGFALLGALKRHMPEIMLEIGGFNPALLCGALDGKKRKALLCFLKSVTITPGAPRPFSEAVVAAGGVDVDEVDPSSMESKKQKGVYLTGEILDIDGDSGGFNLQFAWSTGALAGASQIRPSA
jgi:predicted Rossmann fold flavoprotein